MSHLRRFFFSNLFEKKILNSFFSNLKLKLRCRLTKGPQFISGFNGSSNFRKHVHRVECAKHEGSVPVVVKLLFLPHGVFATPVILLSLLVHSTCFRLLLNPTSLGRYLL